MSLGTIGFFSFSVAQSSSELTFEIIAAGTGEEAKPGQRATLHYIGKLEDGSVFDSSRDRGEPFSFTLGAGQVIQGWEQGVLGMQIGEIRTLNIPPELGYGESLKSQTVEHIEHVNLPGCREGVKFPLKLLQAAAKNIKRFRGQDLRAEKVRSNFPSKKIICIIG